MTDSPTSLTPKIFGIGQPKTATSSLGTAFDLLGFKHKTWDEQLWYACRAGNHDLVFQVAEQFQAFEDLPWCEFGFYKLLDERFPGSKFILTVRDEEQYLRSWMNFRKNFLGKEVPPTTDGVARVYREHNQGVKDYFKNRPDDLLVMDICAGDGWEVLCPFLGLDRPEAPFPFVNKGVYPSSGS